MRFRIATPTETHVKIKKLTEVEATRDEVIAELRDRHLRDTRVFFLPGDLVDASRGKMLMPEGGISGVLGMANFSAKLMETKAYPPALALVRATDNNDQTLRLVFFSRDGDCTETWFHQDGVRLIERVNPETYQKPGSVYAETVDDMRAMAERREAPAQIGPDDEITTRPSAFDRIFGKR